VPSMRKITEFLRGVNARRSSLPANPTDFAAYLGFASTDFAGRPLTGIVNFAPQSGRCVGLWRSPVL
jgi:hypothetical protein